MATSRPRNLSHLPLGLSKLEWEERLVIVAELRKRGGHGIATADALGICRETLYRRIRKLKITSDDFPGQGFNVHQRA